MSERSVRVAEKILGKDSLGPNRFPALDGVRALAMLSVLCLHVLVASGSPTMNVLGLDPGKLVYIFRGVEIFFILSGLLLARPWFLAELGGAPKPDIRKFFGRRARRILPAYYVSIAVLLVIFVPLGMIKKESVTGEIGAWNLGLHALMLHNSVPISMRDFNGINGVLWTLSIEALFYALLPIVVLAFLGRRWRIAIPVAAVVALTWAWLVTHSLQPLIDVMIRSVSGHTSEVTGVPATESFMRTELANEIPRFALLFALGIAIARLVVLAEVRGRKEAPWWAHPNAGLLGFVAGIGWLTLATLDRTSRTPPPDLSHLLTFGVLDGFAYGLLLYGIMFGPRKLRAPFEWVPLRMIGVVSYGMYLAHLPIIYLLVRRHDMQTVEPGLGRLAILLPLTLAIAIVVGTISWRLIERPMLRQRTSPISSSLRKLRTAAVGILVAGAVTATAIVIATTDNAAPPATTTQGTTIQDTTTQNTTTLGTATSLFTAIPDTKVNPDLSGATTPAEAQASGLSYPAEVALLDKCGATAGQRALLVNPQWSVSATAFGCRGNADARTALTAIAAWEKTIGFNEVKSTDSGLVFYKNTEPPTPTHPDQYHVRITHGQWVIGLAIQARTPKDGELAIDALIKALDPMFRT